MPDDNGRPSVICEKLRSQLYDALKDVDDEENITAKVKILRAFVFGHGLAVLDHISRIYRRLPRRQWIVNVASGVGLVTIMSGVVFAAVKINHFENCAQRNWDKANAAEQHAGKLEDRETRIERQVARIDGNIEILMESRGLRPLPPVKDSADTLP